MRNRQSAILIALALLGLLIPLRLSTGEEKETTAEKQIQNLAKNQKKILAELEKMNARILAIADKLDKKGDKYHAEKLRKEKTLLAPKALNHIINLYKAEISYTDSQIGRLLRKIRELDIYDKTLIILTADHGEDLYEHNYFIGHGHYLYEPSLRIPLILNHPDIPPGVFFNNIESLDFAPTILSFLDLTPSKKMIGRNLLSLIYNGKLPFKGAFYGETELRKFYIKSSGWKFLYDRKGKPELYNLNSDPNEWSNLYNENHPKAKVMKKKLLNWLQKHQKNRPVVKLNQDPDMLGKLKALGYIN